jgi:hypothetical protein
MADIKEMIEGCESAAETPVQNGGTNFSQWEREFLESVSEQYESRGSLTERQVEILAKLYDKT